MDGGDLKDLDPIRKLQRDRRLKTNRGLLTNSVAARVDEQALTRPVGQLPNDCAIEGYSGTTKGQATRKERVREKAGDSVEREFGLALPILSRTTGRIPSSSHPFA